MTDLADAILGRNSDRSNQPALICTGQELSFITYAILGSWVKRNRVTFEAAGQS